MGTFRRYRDRREAGRALAAELTRYARRRETIVLGLPRGGVPVAYEVARALELPLDIFVVRKLGVPGNEEYAMGAIASGGALALNHEVIDGLGLSDEIIAAATAREKIELARREKTYRGDSPPLVLSGKTVIVVDDGLATGSSMKAALVALRRLDPDRIVVAVPVAAADTCALLKPEVDEIICALTPQPFHAVGRWYEDFSPTSDAEVQTLLSDAQSMI